MQGPRAHVAALEGTAIAVRTSPLRTSQRPTKPVSGELPTTGARYQQTRVRGAACGVDGNVRLLEAEPAPGKREPGLVAGKWR